MKHQETVSNRKLVSVEWGGGFQKSGQQPPSAFPVTSALILLLFLGMQGVAGLCPAVPAALSSYFPQHTCSEDPWAPFVGVRAGRFVIPHHGSATDASLPVVGHLS